jgi:DNA-damage-inducible protein J
MTATTSMLHIRVDDDIKAQASQMLAAVGMTMSEAVRLFLHRVVAEQAYPLELKVPNAATRAAMLEADELVAANSARAQTHEKARFDTAQALFDDLDKNRKQ